METTLVSTNRCIFLSNLDEYSPREHQVFFAAETTCTRHVPRATCHAPLRTHYSTRHRMHAHIRTHARTYTPTPHFAACRLLTRAATTIFQFFLLYYINIVTKISCFSNFLIIVWIYIYIYIYFIINIFLEDASASQESMISDQLPEIFTSIMNERGAAETDYVCHVKHVVNASLMICTMCNAMISHSYANL